MKKSKEKGKSHSSRPMQAGAPSWLRRTPEEVGGLIVDLFRRGYSPSLIGLTLRDQYGITMVKQVSGRKITQLLKEKGLQLSLPEDLSELLKRSASVAKHLEEHPKDHHSEHGLRLVEAKIHRLTKYYKARGTIPSDWEYASKKAAAAAK